MAILAIVWYILGFICYVKPFRSGESIASDSWKSVDKWSRDNGVVGAVGGIIVAVFVMLLTIGLGGLSWFFWWLTNQDQ